MGKKKEKEKDKLQIYIIIREFCTVRSAHLGLTAKKFTQKKKFEGTGFEEPTWYKS